MSQKFLFDRNEDACTCSAAMSVPPPRYKRPPVIERVVSVRAKMDQELYDQGFGEWKERLLAEFPVDEPVQNWHVSIKKKKGIPSDFSSELQITPRFSEKSGIDGFGWSIRCPLGQLTMNMHSSHAENRSYSDLRNRFFIWFDEWVKHFGVEDFTDISVHYVNLLDATTLPSFSDVNSLQIQKVLKLFFNVSCENDSFMPPMDCRLTIQLKSDPGGVMHIHATDQSEDNNPALTLNLMASTTLRKGQNVQEILSLMDWCHERIIERFELIFTEEAKNSFELS